MQSTVGGGGGRPPGQVSTMPGGAAVPNWLNGMPNAPQYSSL